MSGAQPLSEDEAPRLHAMVRELSHSAGVPVPRFYMIPQDQPNAFATGRSLKHSAVAVTRGITQLLSESELRGVIAHELAHIKNRDILTTSIAAAIGGAITYLGYMLLFMGGDDDSPLGLVGALAMMFLAPIAATLIQLGIPAARVRADATGACISGSANALADAARAPACRRAGDPHAGEPGRRAAVHREAVQRRRDGIPVLDPPPIEERVRRCASWAAYNSSISVPPRSWQHEGAVAAVSKGTAALFFASNLQVCEPFGTGAIEPEYPLADAIFRKASRI